MKRTSHFAPTSLVLAGLSAIFFTTACNNSAHPESRQQAGLEEAASLPEWPSVRVNKAPS